MKTKVLLIALIMAFSLVANAQIQSCSGGGSLGCCLCSDSNCQHDFSGYGEPFECDTDNYSAFVALLVTRATIDDAAPITPELELPQPIAALLDQAAEEAVQS
jgi:hypothetical protein